MTNELLNKYAMKNKLSNTLLLPYEIEIHYKRPLFDAMIYIKCAEDADKILRASIDLNKLDLKECFWVLLLTNANRLLGISEVAVGSSKGVIINIKEIFQLALKTNACNLIIAHNHPSGQLKLSTSDKEQTRKFKEIARIMEINLLDHLVITSESFLSFANEGEL